jgi:2-dehydro-3-deoxyphosphogluconate aldolase / (4S)-4-hydroxy-2-oxoglutarate aldolase
MFRDVPMTPTPAAPLSDTLALAEPGPVIPVIVIQRLADAVPLAQALVAGGVRVLEVTLRTPVALAAIEAIARAVPQAIVGAGTLRSPGDARAARDAGCRFGVSPGFTQGLSDACRAAGLPLLPGVATASEAMQAMDEGHRFLKLFPATAVGGVPLLKGLAGPFPDLAFCPTGGITAESAPQFLALPNVRVCGGSWLTPDAAVAAGDWARITELARQAQALRG